MLVERMDSATFNAEAVQCRDPHRTREIPVGPAARALMPKASAELGRETLRDLDEA